MLGLSIRSLLTGLFGLMALVIVGQGFLSLSKVAAANISVVDIATNWLPSIDVVREIETLAEVGRILEGQHVMSLDNDSMTSMDKRMAENDALFVAARRKYEPLISSNAERRTYAEFSKLKVERDLIKVRMLTMSRANQKQEATAVYVGDIRKASVAIRGVLDKLVKINVDSAKEATEAAAANYRVTRILTIVALAVGMAITAGAMTFSLFGLARPIARITASMTLLSGGNTDADIPFVARKDEIGRMAAAVAIFKESMLKGRKLEAEAVTTKESNERERKADMHKLADRFEAAIGEIVGSVASAATELEAAATRLTHTAEDTEQLTTVAAGASEEASSNVQAVASSTEELTSSVNEISRQVQESSRIANEAVRQAQQTDSRINELSHAAGRIGDVVKLITAVAEQTNLLALNATIEAARAGDAGRGFAVVAAEVKNLANQTAKATDEISTQIAGMQSATQDSVLAIKEIGMTIGRISQIASTIASTVEEQGAATQEITRNVHQAAAGTTQVAANIVEVNKGASETGSASSQVLSSARALSMEGNKLKIEVNKFLATVRAA